MQKLWVPTLAVGCISMGICLEKVASYGCSRDIGSFLATLAVASVSLIATAVLARIKPHA